MSYYEWCMNKKVDGVYIVVGDYDDQGIYELASMNIPVVSTDIIIPGIHSIISDNVLGINISLDYLFNEQQVKIVSDDSQVHKPQSLSLNVFKPINHIFKCMG